jgi:hypothetical protein
MADLLEANGGASARNVVWVLTDAAAIFRRPVCLRIVESEDIPSMTYVGDA